MASTVSSSKHSREEQPQPYTNMPREEEALHKGSTVSTQEPSKEVPRELQTGTPHEHTCKSLSKIIANLI